MTAAARAEFHHFAPSTGGFMHVETLFARLCSKIVAEQIALQRTCF